MHGETTQPTPISEEEYKRFKQWVQDVHGTTRGHLSTEIENALREYRQPDNSQDKLSRIEDDLASLRAMVADDDVFKDNTPATPETSSTRTHADGGKPNPNAPRSEKISWLVAQYDESGGSTTAEEITNRVQDEFGFNDRTAEKYVGLVVDELGAKVHPNNTDVRVWGSDIETVRESVQEQAESDTSARMEELEAAEAEE